MKKGFTLAEVLITLGIIGVVAAITMPVITKSYRKQVIETSLQKFYTNMNQALKLSSLKNGEYKDWQFPSSRDSADLQQSWYEKYLKGYLKNVEEAHAFEANGREFYSVVFADGTVMAYGAQDFFFCLNQKALNDFLATNEVAGKGSKCFIFGFYPNSNFSAECVNDNFRGKGLEPYLYGGVDCSQKDYYKWYPSKVIQMNGWKIPDDYAWKY